MTWPITPLFTYVATISQVRAADLNSIQGGVNVLYAPISIPGCAGGGPSATKGTNGSITSSASSRVLIPIVLPVGIKIGSISVVGLRTGGFNPTYALQEFDNAVGGTTNRGSVVGTSTARETLAISAINYTLLAAKTYMLEAFAGAGSTVTVFMIVVTPAA